MVAQSNPRIKQWMAENSIPDMRALLSMYEGRVLSLAAAAGRSYLVWQACAHSFTGTQIVRVECEHPPLDC